MKGSLKYSNDELIKGIQEKDNLVLSYIIKQNTKSLKQYVLNNSGCEADANDVLQEAIIVLFRKVKEDNFKLTSSLNTFIFSIGRLIWLKELKTRKVQNTGAVPFDIADESDNINSTIERNDRLRLYREKFEELGEECKKVLRLFYLGTPMSQISKFMNYSSEGFTKKKKYACKNALVNIIKSSRRFKELGHEKC